MVRYYQRGDEVRLDLQDPRSIDRWIGVMRLVSRYFRYTVRDIDRIPRQGPALLLLNHGPVPIDAALLGMTLYETQGRLPRALTDHIVFRLPGLRELFLAIGAVDGRHETGGELLERGNLLIVMPGGAPEAFKPSTKAYELYWRRRTGFARLAIRTQAPIVPCACIGIDELYTVPVDLFETGKKLTGLRSLPIGPMWGIGPLPRRVPLTHWIGEPIVPDVPPEAEHDEAAVLALRDRVVDAEEALIAAGLQARADGETR
jgi:1-acyl-sn-glycerol-3-phosphate acyltransferase